MTNADPINRSRAFWIDVTFRDSNCTKNHRYSINSNSTKKRSYTTAPRNPDWIQKKYSHKNTNNFVISLHFTHQLRITKITPPTPATPLRRQTSSRWLFKLLAPLDLAVFADLVHHHCLRCFRSRNPILPYLNTKIQDL